MGSITYDYLNESFLFDDGEIERNFASYSNKEIDTELEKYVEFILSNSGEIESEINEQESDLKVFSSTKEHSVSFLKQTALYLDQIIIQDPLLNQSTRQTTETETVGKHIGYSPLEVDKSEVAKVCKYLKEITPMVSANHIKLFPISEYVNTKWSKQLYLNSIKSKGILPQEVDKFYWDNVKLSNVKSNGKGQFFIDPKDEFNISRAIHVSFGDDNIANGNIFHKTQMLLYPPDENNQALLKMIMPKELPTKLEFEHWVSDSIDSSAINHYSTTVKEIELSVLLGSTYLTDEQVKSDLLRLNSDVPENTIESYSLEKFLNYELPYLDNIDLDKLMELKEYDGEIFENFRIELQRNLRELRSLTDPDQMREKIESIYHEFYIVQSNKVNQKVNQFKQQLASTAVISMASLIPAIATNGLSLLALLMAGANGYRDYSKYYEEAKNNPAFLFWKTRKKNR